MRKIILSVAVSLDGLIEGPNGEYDWCLTDQDYGLSEFFSRVDTMFLGRKSYELFYSSPENSFGLPKMKEYVFSNTLEKVKDDAVLINGDIKTEVAKIKAEKGKDIWLFGGASLTTSLMNLGLVDELMMGIHPIILGSGKPAFQHLDSRTTLTLTRSEKFETGLLMCYYDVHSNLKA